ncbi:unnamed protein product [Pneumocystis jirovecii]|uniref:Peptidyl-prolyl cis-trans isomerase n=1 Tax=Pneumocystis jirovecii TaxID=42068 RepID=L0PAA8_PNEJI|nr:unnamed protein product [Pneumocystis jirovecii]
MGDVILDTTMGPVTIELYYDHAPKVEISKRGYYNGVVVSNYLKNIYISKTKHLFQFHRIIPDFIIQGGDPTGTGRGGSSIYGDSFEDEIHPDLKHTGAGIISMANSGPGTNGSQFFITLNATPWLDGKHTIFGRVKHGMRVVQRMGLVKTDSNDRPEEDIKIRKALVTDL